MTGQADGPSDIPAPLSPGQVEEVASAWGFEDLPVITPFQHGENRHYFCRGNGHDYFLRVSAPRGRSADNLASELAWIEALSGPVATSNILKTRDGQSFVTMTFDDGHRFAVIFEALHGYHLIAPTPGDWQTYGRVLRELHHASSVVMEQKDDRWIGRARGTFAPLDCIAQVPEILLNTPWVDRNLALAFAAEAEHLTRALETTDVALDEHAFIHFDLHLGNLLLTHQGWVVLDFEECCFGPRAMDLGVVRLHARSETRSGEHLGEIWEPFTRGYGDTSLAAAAPLGAALKALHLAGKIPSRMDVPQVAKAPAKILEHLLNAIRQEIN